jgi:hypothetical protein
MRAHSTRPLAAPVAGTRPVLAVAVTPEGAARRLPDWHP